ncbi:MAG: M6 family metalloprotease domain-containing protein [Gemmatimonadota bacterium]|nr:MAG: M6 family metalloprotease domain-containing protein [Gemmatimonadota bacterium]
MTAARRWLLLVLGVAVLAASSATAQDIEVVAQVAGRELPEGYYELIQRNPEFFRPSGGWITRAERAIAAAQPVAGEMPVVVIPALFADSPDPYPYVTADELQRVLFDGPAEEGTLVEYYAEVSGGRLRLYGEVLPWVSTNLTLAEVVGGNYGIGGDSRVSDYLVEALTLLDPTTDFGRFDNDGPDDLPNSGDDDGVVDAVAFEFLEIAASCGGPGIWPHFSRISNWRGDPFVTDDPRPGGGFVRLDPYFIQSAVNCDGTDVQPITTIAHELGHLLGLPDLYHPVYGILPEQRRWVVGCWSLMAAGAWGCGDVARSEWKRPTHVGAWEKQQLGWLDQVRGVPAGELQELMLAPVQTAREILEIPLGEPERLLVEYRQRISFDRDLPAEGVLIYRINDTIPFRPCRDCAPLYRVMLVEADGNGTLVRTAPEGGNRGEPGDAFGAFRQGKFTGFTNPSTRLNAALGDESDVSIYRITLEDGAARLVLSTAPISLARLLGPLLLDGANRLSGLEERYLDARNNQNKRYDVGDLRAYLQCHANRQPLP